MRTARFGRCLGGVGRKNLLRDSCKLAGGPLVAALRQTLPRYLPGAAVRKFILWCAIVALTGAVPALAREHCSIRPAKGMSDAQLVGLAKLSQAAAAKIAVARLNATAAVAIASAELEAEHGCLIWSFDLRVADRPGVQEIQVDAGNGRVLSVKHENPRQEAAEAKSEQTASPGK
jgi:hypothetical protein